ncbi:hypothetical protein [Actinoplanes derwentensis]|uniref:Nuclease-related domain-containing protein n=1 Tax=Actinoplanes derwentensis TaxID=113562 RepID=A0A1H1UFS1_9ACTN|nr:hypothetical protein [Actinoplanes derwentensis]GID85294.1 hypothetical protein Ade03nite_42180 [Actinoplanes derwentensis]SDS71347.1 hypothetical protein SAMN04489716_1427 [Actinoplanes derwentensis]
MSSRLSPAEWVRRRRADLVDRRLEVAGARAFARLDSLGESWHIVDWSETGLSRRHDESDPLGARAGFLAVGPGGVYAVTVADQMLFRVLIVGDVVQINGKRLGYVAEAKRAASRAATALSSAAGIPVPVVPVLAFTGAGTLSTHGVTTTCAIVTERELDKVLTSSGHRISPDTATRLARIARDCAPAAGQSPPER